MIRHRFRVISGALLLLIGAAASAEAQELGRGAFTGQSGHRASGHVSVARTESGAVLRLERDFRFDGAPDPKLGFGRGGYRKETQFSPLLRNVGPAEYAVPAEIDVGQYDEVWLWCEKFDVPLGVAKLTR